MCQTANSSAFVQHDIFDQVLAATLRSDLACCNRDDVGNKSSRVVDHAAVWPHKYTEFGWGLFELPHLGFGS